CRTCRSSWSSCCPGTRCTCRWTAGWRPTTAAWNGAWTCTSNWCYAAWTGCATGRGTTTGGADGARCPRAHPRTGADGSPTTCVVLLLDHDVEAAAELGQDALTVALCEGVPVVLWCRDAKALDEFLAVAETTSTAART